MNADEFALALGDPDHHGLIEQAGRANDRVKTRKLRDVEVAQRRVARIGILHCFTKTHHAFISHFHF